MSRACDAIGCEKEVVTGRFMCPRHWHLVPVATQRTINARYRANPTAHALMNDPRYVEACAVAIEHIAVAEGHPGDNSYRRLLTILNRKKDGVI